MFSLKFCDKSVLAILILKTVYLDNLTIISKIITIVVIVIIHNTVILFYVHLFYVPSTEQKMVSLRSTQYCSQANRMEPNQVIYECDILQLK